MQTFKKLPRTRPTTAAQTDVNSVIIEGTNSSLMFFLGHLSEAALG
jgi:hypothetical protein